MIESKLCERWSPEQIVGPELKGKLSFKTIYNWLYKNFFDVSLDKGKSAKTKEKRGKFNIGKSISERPEEVKRKEQERQKLERAEQLRKELEREAKMYSKISDLQLEISSLQLETSSLRSQLENTRSMLNDMW
mgnify:CR=1 FL=1